MPIDPNTIILPPKIAEAAEREWTKRSMTREDWMAELAGRMERAEQSPAPGEPALDFNLEKLTPEGSRSGNFIRLSSYQGTSVGLVFGSNPCPYFRQSIDRLNQIHDELSEQVPILGVYIREAHTTDGRQAGPNIEDGILFAKPTSADERAEIAADCIKRLAPKFPLVMDDMDDSTENVYKALPLRLFTIDHNGVVIYRSGPGPHFFNPEEWYSSLNELAKIKSREK